MKRSRILSVVVLLLVAVFITVYSAQPGHAAAFPERDILLVVTAGPGGGGDTFCRQIAKSVAAISDVNIVVENHPAGGGAEAMSYIWQRPHDGHTMIICTNSTFICNPYSYTMPRQITDWKGVIRVQTDATVLVVNSSAGINTVEEFVEKAKTKKMTIGGYAVGSVEHIAAFLLAKEAGFEFEYVPYDTSADAIVAVLGGHLDATFTQYAEVAGNHKAGEIVVLGAAAPQRYEALPDVPTFVEKGWKIPELANWRGYVVPKDVPDETVKFLHDMVKKATEESSYQEYVKTMSLSDAYMDGPEFTKLLEEQYKQMGELLNEIGLLNQ